MTARSGCRVPPPPPDHRCHRRRCRRSRERTRCRYRTDRQHSRPRPRVRGGGSGSTSPPSSKRRWNDRDSGLKRRATSRPPGRRTRWTSSIALVVVQKCQGGHVDHGVERVVEERQVGGLAVDVEGVDASPDFLQHRHRYIEADEIAAEAVLASAVAGPDVENTVNVVDLLVDIGGFSVQYRSRIRRIRRSSGRQSRSW